MKIINQSHEILTDYIFTSEGVIQMLKNIEKAGRTAYKSEGKTTDLSFRRFVRMIIDRGHESVLEHESISVKLTTNRAIANELVRHRLASYTQESTRYVNYGKKGEIRFIMPILKNKLDKVNFIMLFKQAEKNYNSLIEIGLKPEIARDILPLATATEIVITANLREWRHIFKLRIHKTAHPQMRELMKMVLSDFKKYIPIIFDDIKD